MVAGLICGFGATLLRKQRARGQTNQLNDIAELVTLSEVERNERANKTAALEELMTKLEAALNDQDLARARLIQGETCIEWLTPLEISNDTRNCLKVDHGAWTETLSRACASVQQLVDETDKCTAELDKLLSAQRKQVSRTTVETALQHARAATAKAKATTRAVP